MDFFDAFREVSGTRKGIRHQNDTESGWMLPMDILQKIIGANGVIMPQMELKIHSDGWLIEKDRPKSDIPQIPWKKFIPEEMPKREIKNVVVWLINGLIKQDDWMFLGDSIWGFRTFPQVAYYCFYEDIPTPI